MHNYIIVFMSRIDLRNFVLLHVSENLSRFIELYTLLYMLRYIFLHKHFSFILSKQILAFFKFFLHLNIYFTASTNNSRKHVWPRDTWYSRNDWHFGQGIIYRPIVTDNKTRVFFLYLILKIHGDIIWIYE